MCMFSSPSIPEAPAPPPPPEPPKDPPTRIDPAVKSARLDERKRIAANQGPQGTIMTSSRGLLGSANTNKRSLLGGGE